MLRARPKVATLLRKTEHTIQMRCVNTEKFRLRKATAIVLCKTEHTIQMCCVLHENTSRQT